MRPGPLLGSLFAHAAALVAVAGWLRDHAAAAPDATLGQSAAPAVVWLEPAPDAERPAVSDARPIEVELVRDLDASGIRPAESPTSGMSGVSRTSGTAEIRTSGASGASEPRTSDTSGASGPDYRKRPGSPYMHMRGPEWHLDDRDADAILDHPLPPPPQVERSGRLEPAPGGRGVVHDAVTTVTVERDGTAHFHDAKDIDFHLHVPLPSLDELRHSERALHDFGDGLGRELRKWYADPQAIARGGPATDLPDHWKAEPNQCDRWGDQMCVPEPMPPPNTLASGKADLTSYLMRKLHVGDPFASRKKALLDATRAERIERGTKFRAEQLARSAELMRGHLERLWATTTDAAARRAALFALWDECAEGEGAAGEAGERARAEVIGWIGEHLPAPSPDAYSQAEIAQLDARRTSLQHFAPYPARP